MLQSQSNSNHRGHQSLYLLALLVPIIYATSIKENAYALCEEYIECETLSKLQDRLCVGNSMNPYWLPSPLPTQDRCHKKLKNDYIHLERLERELQNRKLRCVNDTLQNEPNYRIVEEQSPSCTPSLLGMSKRFRDANGNIMVNRCFQGNRIGKQCGVLRECCSQLKKCEQAVAKTVVAEDRTARIRAILKKARDCKAGLEISELTLEDGYSNEQPINGNNDIQDDSTSGLSQQNVPKLEEIHKFSQIKFNEEKPETVEGSGQDSEVPIEKVNLNENSINGIAVRTDRDHPIETDEMLDKGLIIIKFHTPNETDSKPSTKNTVTNMPESQSDSTKVQSRVTYDNLAYRKAILNENKRQQQMAEKENNELLKAEAIRKKNENDISEFNSAYYNLERLSEKIKKQRLGKKLDSQNSEHSYQNANIESSAWKTHDCNTTSSNPNREETRRGLLQTLLRMIQKLYLAVKRMLENEGGQVSEEFELDNNVNKVEMKFDTKTPCNAQPINDAMKNQEKKPEVTEDTKISTLKPKITAFPAENNDNNSAEASHSTNTENTVTEAILTTTPDVERVMMAEATLSQCDKYLSCRNQLFRQLDKCSMLAVRRNRAFAISTESLLHLSSRCNITTDSDFMKLYLINSENTQRLRLCLYDSGKAENKQKLTLDSNVVSQDLLKNIGHAVYTNERDCYADVNALQLVCASLRSFCSSFHRCREETSTASSENAILELTAKLATNYQSCLEEGITAGVAIQDVEKPTHVKEIINEEAAETSIVL